MFRILDIMRVNVSSMICLWFLSVLSGAQDHISILLPCLFASFYGKNVMLPGLRGFSLMLGLLCIRLSFFLDNLGVAGTFKKGDFVGDLGCK